MALIKCPECGKEVSSNANQCIHCGCKFTVCPECGNITVGEVSICQQCGYSFKKIKTINKAVEENNSKLDGDLFKQWQNASPVDGIIMKVLKIAKYIVYVLPLIFLIILSVAYTKWQNADELEKIMTFSKTQDKIKTMIAFACIFSIIDALSNSTISAFTKFRCSNWIRNSKIDGVRYLRIHCNEIGDDKAIENFQLLSEAVYYADKFKHKNIIYIKLIVYLLCAVALFVSGGVCVMQNLTEAMYAKINGREFDFQYSALIAFGVIAAISLIIVIALEVFGSKNYDAWFKQVTEDAIDN